MAGCSRFRWFRFREQNTAQERTKPTKKKLFQALLSWYKAFETTIEHHFNIIRSEMASVNHISFARVTGLEQIRDKQQKKSFRFGFIGLSRFR